MRPSWRHITHHGLSHRNCTRSIRHRCPYPRAAAVGRLLSDARLPCRGHGCNHGHPACVQGRLGTNGTAERLQPCTREEDNPHQVPEREKGVQVIGASHTSNFLSGRKAQCFPEGRREVTPVPVDIGPEQPRRPLMSVVMVTPLRPARLDRVERIPHVLPVGGPDLLERAHGLPAYRRAALTVPALGNSTLQPGGYIDTSRPST